MDISYCCANCQDCHIYILSCWHKKSLQKQSVSQDLFEKICRKLCTLFIVHCKSYALVQSFNRISAVGVKQRNRYFKKKSAHQRQKMKCIITFPFIPKILKNANNHRHRRLQNLYERVGTYIEWAMVSISCSRNACRAKTGNLRHKYKNT